MTMLFALGQHPARPSAQARFQDDERVFACSDDIYASCRFDRVGAVFAILQQELESHAHIQLHLGKTQDKNRRGVVPVGIEQLTRLATRVKPGAVVWRGDTDLPLSQQGIRVLGVPIGQPEFVRHFLPGTSNSLPTDSMVECCVVVSVDANFWLRTVRPDRFIRSSPDDLGLTHSTTLGKGDLHVAPLCGRSGIDERTMIPGRRTLGKLGGLQTHGKRTATCHCGDAHGWRDSASRLQPPFLEGIGGVPPCGRETRSPTSQSLGGSRRPLGSWSNSSCARRCGLV